jgi:hypothetical protein
MCVALPVHFIRCMTSLTSLLLTGALALTGVGSALSVTAADTVDSSVRMLRIIREGSEERGTAVLIHRDDRGSDAVLHFLTSSCLFKTAQGDQRPSARTIELLLDDGQRPVEITRGDVFMPGGGCLDIAIFCVTAPATIRLVPQRVIYDPPPAGAAFLVAGYDPAGRLTSVAAHIRFRSTLLAMGDRDVSTLHGCAGAAALLPGGEGVFGVVSECDPHRSVVISLLSLARSFIERHITPRREAATPTTVGRLR